MYGIYLQMKSYFFEVLGAVRRSGGQLSWYFSRHHKLRQSFRELNRPSKVCNQRDDI